ncbi:Gfo/Idh/MocA family protein [Actinomadura keratinilytica]
MRGDRPPPHAPRLRRLPGHPPGRRRRPRPERARATAEPYGARPVHGYRNLLAMDDIDAVYVPLPAALHHTWAEAALHAGKHVLAEKPLTTDARATARLLRLAEERGLALAENTMFVHHPQHTAVRELLDAGAIGELRSFRAEFTVPRFPADDIRLQPELGGGALWDTGVYPVRAALHLLGPELEAVGAVLTEDPAHGVDTHGAALLRTPRASPPISPSASTTATPRSTNSAAAGAASPSTAPSPRPRPPAPAADRDPRGPPRTPARPLRPGDRRRRRLHRSGYHRHPARPGRPAPGRPPRRLARPRRPHPRELTPRVTGAAPPTPARTPPGAPRPTPGTAAPAGPSPPAPSPRPRPSPRPAAGARSPGEPAPPARGGAHAGPREPARGQTPRSAAGPRAPRRAAPSAPRG